MFCNEYLYSGVLLGDSKQQHTRCKIMSQIYRKCAKSITGTPLHPEQVAVLAYLELAFGRTKNVTDWAQEQKNRCGTRHHIRSPRDIKIHPDGTALWHDVVLGQKYTKEDPRFYHLLAAEVKSIVKDIVGTRQVQETFTQFYARRHEWIASGSSGGHKLPTNPVLGKAGGSTVNKRGWAEDHAECHITQYMIERPPTELATASEKFENGKSRAIYGVMPEHYVINTYVTQGMEERLHKVDGLEKGATGLAELKYVCRRVRITEDATQECTMLDYADFNIHHTPKAQEVLFTAIRERGLELGACRDWLNCASWLARAKLNQRVMFPGNRVENPVTQGMFSGTRSTDLINTLSLIHI